jgi:hypothetical protein
MKITDLGQVYKFKIVILGLKYHIRVNLDYICQILLKRQINNIVVDIFQVLANNSVQWKKC